MRLYPKFSVVILAAGQSRRMGDINKLLLPVKGEPMVRRAAKLYKNLGMQVNVVVGYEADQMEVALSGLDVQIILNDAYASGQRSSVQIGLNAVDTANCAAVMIALADQPLLTADDITAFCDAFLQDGSGKIMVPYWGESRGNPVMFPAKTIEDMRAGNKVSNVRKFVDSNPDIVTRYDAPTNHFVQDIDTYEAAMRILPQLS